MMPGAASLAYLRQSKLAVQTVVTLALAMMVAINAAEILHRVLYTRGLNWVQELSIILAMYLYFLSYALIAKDREYIRVDLLARVLPPQGQRVLAIATRLLVLGFHATLAWYAVTAVRFTSMFETSVLSWPEYVFFLPLAVGCTDIVVTECLFLSWQLRGIEVVETRAGVLT